MKRLISLFAAGFAAAPAFAEDPVIGAPKPGGIGFQPPATSLAEDAFWFHDVILMPIITIISLFVTVLLIWVMIRYNKKSNPVPSTFTHNTTAEVLWTGIPVLILIAIAWFSFPLLYKFDAEPDLQAIAASEADVTPEADRAAAELGWINIKAQGNQWNWTYTYPDFTDADGYPVQFTSNGVHKNRSDDRKNYDSLGRSVPFEDLPKNLAVDYPVVLPEGRYIRYYTAAADVIHAWTVPAFAVKTDAIPGRLNQGWFKVDKPGVYYGQCSEICGKDHGYMPIEVRIVSQAKFDRWMQTMVAGDFDEAYEQVADIASLGDDDTQPASSATPEVFEDK